MRQDSAVPEGFVLKAARCAKCTGDTGGEKCLNRNASSQALWPKSAHLVKSKETLWLIDSLQVALT